MFQKVALKILSLIDPSKYRVYLENRIVLNSIKKKGRNLSIGRPYIITNPEFIELGDNVFIAKGCHISAKVQIGNNVMFGPDIKIIGGDHLYGILGESVRWLKPKNNENILDIVIEDEVWCGANIIVLKGVTIGMGSVIGAGSIVSKSIPPYTVAVGNPCKPVKRIFSDEELLDHIRELGYSNDMAIDIISKRNKEFLGD